MEGKKNSGQGETNRVHTGIKVLQGVDYSVINDFKEQSVELAEIRSITSDSRKCISGSAFVAINGNAADGHAYIREAEKAGAALLVVEQGCRARDEYAECAVPVLEVEDSRMAYGVLAANIYDNPAEQLSLIGITGTNGKTTITYLLEEVLIGMGHPVGVVGTVDYRWFGADCKKYSKPATRTTPDALELQSLLREMVDVGVEYVIMEVSSHALDQHRLSMVKFEVAAFTNLSHDHLDYHQDLDQYCAAKSLLFSEHLQENGGAVINLQRSEAEGSLWGRRMAEFCSSEGISTLTCGPDETADIKLLEESFNLEGCTCRLQCEGEEFELKSPLVGRFNVENLLTTLAITMVMKLERKEVLPRLGVAGGAPGRLQRVVIPEQFCIDCPEVFIDYAHTPDALAKVLETLGELPHKDLYCVFGCGGDRDNSKRPVMGGIGAELSTVSLVTSDNPRTEDPERILEHVVGGVVTEGVEIKQPDWLLARKKGEKGCVVIQDRSEAIRAAIASAKDGDIVLIAGKGHEKYQITGEGERFFDDCLEAKEAMLSWNCRHVSAAVNGRIEGQVNRWYSGRIETDSRKVTEGDVFVALEGENFDGHEYVEQAVNNGASLAVISNREKVPVAEIVPRIVVEDTLEALGDLAQYRRQLVKGVGKTKMVGITGSCGKTTVKEMTTAIFSRHFPESTKTPVGRVLKTKGNFNNLIGVPLSLFPISLKQEAAVLELGMNRKGEIKTLAGIVDPDISCITNIHAAHLEELKNIEGVAEAKRELFDTTRPDGILVVNLDDPLLKESCDSYLQQKVTFGLESNADVTASDIQQQQNGNIGFTLQIGDCREKVKLAVAGEHSVANALAAAAIALAAGIAFSEIVGGLEDFRPVDKRMAFEELESGIKLINDSYNANPASMCAGLKTLSSMQSQTKIAILGDMLELGSIREDAHYAIGQKVSDFGINFLALYGDSSQFILKGAIDSGMSPERVKIFSQKSELSLWIKTLMQEKKLQAGDWALLKGSRGMKMETVLEDLRENS